jgi:hypothetical protein
MGDRIQGRDRPRLVGVVDRVEVLGAPKPVMVRLFWDGSPNIPRWFCKKNLKVIAESNKKKSIWSKITGWFG